MCLLLFLSMTTPVAVNALRRGPGPGPGPVSPTTKSFGPLGFRPRRTPSSSLTTVLNPQSSSRFDRFLTKLYDGADVDHDGSISTDELYLLVLKLYIQLNRQAPIPAPSREQINRLYRKADINHNNKITRDEFTMLAKMIGRRASLRLIAHKCITLLCAPLLAEYVLRQLSKHQEYLHSLAETIVPNRFHNKVLPIITSRSFCRTIVLIAFIVSLGNLVLNIVNWFLDHAIADDDYDDKSKKTRKWSWK